MACVHLNQLFQLCQDSQVRLSSTDLIHLVCKQCEKVEVCPSILYEEYDREHAIDDEENPLMMNHTEPLDDSINAS